MTQQLLEAPWRESPKGAIYASLEELKKYASTAEIAKELQPTDKFKKTIGDFSYSVKVWPDGKVSVFRNTKEKEQQQQQNSKGTFKVSKPKRQVHICFSETETNTFLIENPDYEFDHLIPAKTGLAANDNLIFVTVKKAYPNENLILNPVDAKNDHGGEMEE